MKGDFTRDTFDPLKNFSRVLMQQGRVQLDADWNEQTSILLYYLRTLAEDILGPYAGPKEALGFELITKGSINKLTDKGKKKTWNSIEPDDVVRRKYLMNEVDSGNGIISAGRYYVRGILVENHRNILYTEQPGYPFTPKMELSSLTNTDHDMIAYLDVWERHITYVQDDDIREKALGGADTCTRAKVVWQVKFLVKHNQKDNNDFNCDKLENLLARDNPPKLRARAKRAARSSELCTTSPQSKYMGLENQLYRVEVHEVANGQGTDKNTGISSFKWSRDNGSVVFPIATLTGSVVIVETLGRDQCTMLKPGDWVEISNDELALREQSGPLAQVESVDRDELTITLKCTDGVKEWPSYTESDITNIHPLLRRWDHVGVPAYDGALLVEKSTVSDAKWIALEDGVEIAFSQEGDYRVGDYWLIPARVATGDIEWPTELNSGRIAEPAELPPHGPKHYYAPLYYFDGLGETKDCRCCITIPTELCNTGVTNTRPTTITG